MKELEQCVFVKPRHLLAAVFTHGNNRQFVRLMEKMIALQWGRGFSSTFQRAEKPLTSGPH